MKNVYYYALADDTSSFYRLQGVLPYIQKKNIKLTDISHLNPLSWATILTCDILILQRVFSEGHLNIVKQAQLIGCRVIIDYDDDCLNIPEHNPAYELYQVNKKYLQQCIRMADEIWVSTDGIAESFLKYNKNIHVIPNAWNNYLYPEKNNFNYENKLVLYRGGHTHWMDLLERTSDLSLIASYNPDWHFRYMGMAGNEHFFRANNGNKNVSVTNSVPLIQYLEQIKKWNAPICINPLEDTLLNRSKSNISFMEAVWAGSVYVGEKGFHEFDLPGVVPISDFINGSQRFLEADAEYLAGLNESSWNYISENLFLSKVNDLRIERLLS